MKYLYFLPTSGKTRLLAECGEATAQQPVLLMSSPYLIKWPPSIMATLGLQAQSTFKTCFVSIVMIITFTMTKGTISTLAPNR